MSSKTQLISDIMLRIQDGKPSDDFELSELQVAFWLTNIRDEVVKEYLDSKLIERLSVDEYFIKQESCKPLNNETDPCIDEDKERIYIRLKKTPMDLFKDMGIIRLRTSEGSVINKVKINTIDFIEDIEFSKPSVKNLLYYRDGKTKIVIEGIPKGLKDIIEIIVWYVPKENIMELNDDDEVSLPNELVPIVLERVEELARRQMMGIADVTNDGFDNITNIPNA